MRADGAQAARALMIAASPAPDEQTGGEGEGGSQESNVPASRSQPPVPLAEAALRQIKRSSMALDIYLWLAYRLHSLRGPRPVRWHALRQQFGGGRYGQMFTFCQQFGEALDLALAVYPDAARRGVKVVEDGLVLSPCDLPVAKRSADHQFLLP